MKPTKIKSWNVATRLAGNNFSLGPIRPSLGSPPRQSLRQMSAPRMAYAGDVEDAERVFRCLAHDLLCSPSSFLLTSCFLHLTLRCFSTCLCPPLCVVGREYALLFLTPDGVSRFLLYFMLRQLLPYGLLLAYVVASPTSRPWLGCARRRLPRFLPCYFVDIG